jgi:hypothetical protein
MRRCDEAVAGDVEFESRALEHMTRGDAINLLLHGAGVDVY